MRAATRTVALSSALLLMAPGMLAACGGHYVRSYRNVVARNRLEIQNLKLGMSSEEVHATMRQGELVRYKKIELSNPWRSESFMLDEGTRVVILYYVTERQQHLQRAQNDELTPVVLEDDGLVGWGWSFVKRNLHRYQTQEHSIP